MIGTGPLALWWHRENLHFHLCARVLIVAHGATANGHSIGNVEVWADMDDLILFVQSMHHSLEKTPQFTGPHSGIGRSQASHYFQPQGGRNVFFFLGQQGEGRDWVGNVGISSLLERSSSLRLAGSQQEEEENDACHDWSFANVRKRHYCRFRCGLEL